MTNPLKIRLMWPAMWITNPLKLLLFEDISSICDWLVINSISFNDTSLSIDTFGNYYVDYTFDNESDATLFKLTWLNHSNKSV